MLCVEFSTEKTIIAASVGALLGFVFVSVSVIFPCCCCLKKKHCGVQTNQHTSSNAYITNYVTTNGLFSGEATNSLQGDYHHEGEPTPLYDTIPGETHAQNGEKHLKTSPEELVYEDIATAKETHSVTKSTFAGVEVDTAPELPQRNINPALQVYDVVSSDHVRTNSSCADNTGEAMYNVLNHNLPSLHMGKSHSRKRFDPNNSEHKQPQDSQQTPADDDENHIDGVAASGEHVHNVEREATYSSLGCCLATAQPLPSVPQDPATEPEENTTMPVYSVVDKSRKKRHISVIIDTENTAIDSVAHVLPPDTKNTANSASLVLPLDTGSTAMNSAEVDYVMKQVGGSSEDHQHQNEPE